jgi:hypothetical protein
MAAASSAARFSSAAKSKAPPQLAQALIQIFDLRFEFIKHSESSRLNFHLFHEFGLTTTAFRPGPA